MKPSRAGPPVRTLRSDVIVLGSTLGGLIAATYLARTGLRVVLVEEEVHAKRTPLLREPFLLWGLEPGGGLHRVFRELSLPLLDQSEIRSAEVGHQVVLPGARIDVRPEPAALAAELAAHGLASRSDALRWVEAVDLAAASTRKALWDEVPPGRGRALGGPIGALRSRIGRSLARARASGGLSPPRVQSPLPAPPDDLGAFAAAEIAALSGLTAPEAAPAPALLLRGAREGVFRMPHGGTPFLDLFRRRFLSLHGEIWRLGSFALASDRNEVGIALPRSRCFASALLLAVPREPLRRVLRESGAPPRWLHGGASVIDAPPRLFRAAKAALPVGLGSRAIVAGGDPGEVRCFALSPDPEHEQTTWLVGSGPGAGAVPAEQPLGALAPFSGDGIVPLDPGPAPRWDLDAVELAFPPRHPPPIRHRALVASVGPELAPGLGFEGQVLQARRVALRLARRLGAQRAIS